LSTNSFELPQLFIGLSAPTPGGNTEQVVSWHRIADKNVTSHDENGCQLSINFGKFWKCGFFDWRIIEVTNQGRFQPCEIIGRP
jgi:hypothetical protein